MKVFSEDKETKANLIEVSILENRCGVWDFPKNTKTLLTETKYVFMEPCKPKNITKKGYAFDHEKAQDIYRYIKSKKLQLHFSDMLTGVTAYTRGNFGHKFYIKQ